MLNRIDTYRKKKKTAFVKVLITMITMVVIMGGTLTVSFANEDLNAVLTKWFDDKRENAIVHIKEAVSSEKEIQKERLKAALKEEMDAAEVEMNQFTAAEKERRVQNIRNYADQLIQGIDIDNSAKEQELKRQLDAIYAEAQKAMQTADANWKSSIVPVEKAETEKPKEEEAKPEEPKAETPAPEAEAPAAPAPTPTAPPVEQPAAPESETPVEQPAGDGE